MALRAVGRGSGAATLYGSGPPDDSLGKAGDSYIDTDTGLRYGPKGITSRLLGKLAFVEQGEGAPDESVQTYGGMYHDTLNSRLYGPKDSPFLEHTRPVVTGEGPPAEDMFPAGIYYADYIDTLTGIHYSQNLAWAWYQDVGRAILRIGTGAASGGGHRREFFYSTDLQRLYRCRPNADVWDDDAPGATFITGAGAPDPTAGAIGGGDYYIDLTSLQVYIKQAGRTSNWQVNQTFPEVIVEAGEEDWDDWSAHAQESGVAHVNTETRKMVNWFAPKTPWGEGTELFSTPEACPIGSMWANSDNDEGEYYVWEKVDGWPNATRTGPRTLIVGANPPRLSDGGLPDDVAIVDADKTIWRAEASGWSTINEQRLPVMLSRPTTMEGRPGQYAWANGLGGNSAYWWGGAKLSWAQRFEPVPEPTWVFGTVDPTTEEGDRYVNTVTTRAFQRSGLDWAALKVDEHAPWSFGAGAPGETTGPNAEIYYANLGQEPSYLDTETGTRYLIKWPWPGQMAQRGTCDLVGPNLNRLPVDHALGPTRVNGMGAENEIVASVGGMGPSVLWQCGGDWSKYSNDIAVPTLSYSLGDLTDGAVVFGGVPEAAVPWAIVAGLGTVATPQALVLTREGENVTVTSADPTDTSIVQLMWWVPA